MRRAPRPQNPAPGLNHWLWLAPPDFRSSRSYVFRPRECHLVKLDVAIRPQKNQQLASGVLRGFGHRLGQVTEATCVQWDRSLELTMKSMGCGLMECLEGIRNPCKLLKTWSGRPDSNRRRPAWEVGQCFVFSNITAHGVDSGYGKRQQTRVRFGWRVNGGYLEG